MDVLYKREDWYFIMLEILMEAFANVKVIKNAVSVYHCSNGGLF